jgi:hypothetical protein
MLVGLPNVRGFWLQQRSYPLAANHHVGPQAYVRGTATAVPRSGS